MKHHTLVVALLIGTVLVLVGCSSGGSSGSNAPPNSCTTNIAGCEAAAFSCPAAGFCYETNQECAASNECSTNTTTNNPTTGGSCVTNVTGCEADAFSCPSAQLCYDTSQDCAASNECQ